MAAREVPVGDTAVDLGTVRRTVVHPVAGAEMVHEGMAAIVAERSDGRPGQGGSGRVTTMIGETGVKFRLTPLW